MIIKTLESLFLNADLNMTVICIAHRIRTIQKADKIWYLENGIIKEEGKFNELTCFKGLGLLA
jgi:ABC-type multidrug transport system fused ATPase/permease subunit